MLFCQFLATTILEKNIKKSYRNINLKYQLQHGRINLNYLRGHILCQILKIILRIYHQKHETMTNNPPILINVNKIEITSKH